MKALSAREIAERRAATVAAVRQIADLAFVNGGGTGSIETTRTEDAVTEIAAGSGLIGPGLFDGYHGFCPRPALLLGLSVVRRPARGVATLPGGGWSSEEHTSELQSRGHLVCRLLLEKKKYAKTHM